MVKLSDFIEGKICDLTNEYEQEITDASNKWIRDRVYVERFNEDLGVFEFSVYPYAPIEGFVIDSVIFINKNLSLRDKINVLIHEINHLYNDF